MVDRTFEMDLDRQFSISPMLPDSDLFAARVSERLDRGWTFRRLLIGGLGLAGGLIGAGQLLGSGLLARVHAITAHSSTLFNTGVASSVINAVIKRLQTLNGKRNMFMPGHRSVSVVVR